MKIQISIIDDAEQSIDIEQVERGQSTDQSVASPADSEVLSAPPQFQPDGVVQDPANPDGEASGTGSGSTTEVSTPDQMGDVIAAPPHFRQDATGTK